MGERSMSVIHCLCVMPIVSVSIIYAQHSLVCMVDIDKVKLLLVT